MRRIGRLIRGLVCLAVAGALVVGVPWVLWRSAGPPSSWPGLAELRRDVEEGDVRPVLVAGLAGLLWLAWLRVAIAVVVELAVVGRRARAPRVRWLGSAQDVAAVLVAGLTVVGPVAPGPPAHAAPGPAHPAPAATPASVAGRPPAGPAGPPCDAWTVQRGDSFWSIATRCLGDGRRWREVVNANVGREVAPGVWFDRTTDVIHPGWVVAVPRAAGTGPPRDVAVVRVQRGDTLSGLAAEHLGDAARWPELWDANRGRHFGNRVFTDPNLILPGWELDLPSAVAPPPAGPGEATGPEPSVAPDVTGLVLPAPMAPWIPFLGGPVLPPPPAEEGTAPEAVPPDGPPDAADVPDVAAPTHAPDPAALVDAVDVPAELEAELDETSAGLPVLAAGAVASGGLLAGLRRRRRGRSASPRSPGAAPASPVVHLDPAGAPAEPPDAARGRLERAWRVACGAVAGRRARPVVAVSGALIVVLFDGDAGEPPDGWLADGPGRWALPSPVATRDLVPSLAALAYPAPALVSIGTIGEAVVHVDLEALGRLVVVGEDASRVLTAIGASAVESAFLERTELALAGIAPREGWPVDAETTARIAVIETWLAAPAPVALRARPLDDPWAPTVLVSAVPVRGDLGAAGPAAVVSAGSEGDWRLAASGAGWSLEPLGLALTPLGVSAADPAAVRARLDAVAPDRAADVPQEPPGVDTHVDTHLVDAGAGFVVRVLGPVDVLDGAGRPVVFERTKSLELVAWLAFHRPTAAREAARDALWETKVRATTFANVVSEARRALQQHAPSGCDEEWIHRAGPAHLRLAAPIVTDVGQFEQHVARAGQLTDDEAIAELWAAVELVRGRPFESVEYRWADLEGWATRFALLVAAVVADLGERCLASGDAAATLRATAVGLGVLPGHEDLVALRLRAHGDLGDLAAVRREWEAYERVLTHDRWADEPSPRLVQLRRDLLGASFASSPGRP